MTVKELAEFTGKTERAVQTWVKKASEKSSLVSEKSSSSSSSRPASYTVEEVEIILNESKLGRNAVMIIMENARKNNQIEKIDSKNQVDYEILGKMIGMAVSAALAPIVNKLDTISSKVLPAPTEEDYYTLIAYASNHGMTLKRSELPIHGRNLVKMCKEEDRLINHIPDERWGKVNSYPVEILDEYFRGAM